MFKLIETFVDYVFACETIFSIYKLRDEKEN